MITRYSIEGCKKCLINNACVFRSCEGNIAFTEQLKKWCDVNGLDSVRIPKLQSPCQVHFIRQYIKSFDYKVQFLVYCMIRRNLTKMHLDTVGLSERQAERLILQVCHNAYDFYHILNFRVEDYERYFGFYSALRSKEFTDDELSLMFREELPVIKICRALCS